MVEENKCTLDPITRRVSVPREYRLLGVESDEKVNRIRFRFPKIVGDNVDLSELNLYVNYQNGNGSKGMYVVNDVTIDNDFIEFSWLLSRNVTMYKGKVYYIVCAKKSTGDEIDNEWHTKLIEGTVVEGLESEQEIEPVVHDLIEQFLSRLVAAEESIPEQVRVSTEAALAQAKESGEFDGPQGPKGEVGPQGPKGEVGPQGPKGDDGLNTWYVTASLTSSPAELRYTDFATAKSINDIKIGDSILSSNGYVGRVISKGSYTISVIRSYSIIGAKGDRGATGPQGPKGDPGEALVRSVNDQTGDVKLTAKNIWYDQVYTVESRLNENRSIAYMGYTDAGEALRLLGVLDSYIDESVGEDDKMMPKSYINDSINSITAWYITKNISGDPFETVSELLNASEVYSGGEIRTPTRNDYCVVRVDETKDSATTRYIYNNGWQFQYIVNETPLTHAQLLSLNSGITAEKVQKYDGMTTQVIYYYADGKTHLYTDPAMEESQIAFFDDVKADLQEPTKFVYVEKQNSSERECYIPTYISATSIYFVRVTLTSSDEFKIVKLKFNKTDNSVNVSTKVAITDLPLAQQMGNAGIVLIKSKAMSGLEISSDVGDLRVSHASTDQIDNRSSARQPISPANLDYSVKRALTDGVGPVYTEREKLSARNRIDAVGNSFRPIFIHTITKNEDPIKNFYVTKDMDGNSFNLRELYIRYRVYKIYDSSGNLISPFALANKAISISINYNDSAMISADDVTDSQKDKKFSLVAHGLLSTYVSSATEISNKQVEAMAVSRVAVISPGIYDCIYTSITKNADVNGATYGTNTARINYGGLTSSAFMANAIRMIRFGLYNDPLDNPTTGNVLPVGSKIEIYGR